MKWFGESWGAPVCHPIDHTETPVGECCIFCPRSIKAGDQGFVLPHWHDESRSYVEVAAHLECFLRAVGVEIVGGSCDISVTSEEGSGPVSA